MCSDDYLLHTTLMNLTTSQLSFSGASVLKHPVFAVISAFSLFFFNFCRHINK